jgi:hypothetical protein
VFYIANEGYTAITTDSLTVTSVLNQPCGEAPNQYNAGRPGAVIPAETMFLGQSYRGNLATSPDARCWKSVYSTANDDPYSADMVRGGRVLK